LGGNGRSCSTLIILLEDEGRDLCRKHTSLWCRFLICAFVNSTIVVVSDVEDFSWFEVDTILLDGTLILILSLLFVGFILGVHVELFAFSILYFEIYELKVKFSNFEF
jgi:hypothetical protein